MNLILRSTIAFSMIGLAACQQAVRPQQQEMPSTVVGTVAPISPPISPPEMPPTPATAEPAEPAAVEPAPDPAHSSGADVFQRLRAGLEPGACEAGGAIARRWQQRLAVNPPMFAKHLEKVLPLMDYVAREVDAAGLPAVFALIPLVESDYRPNAVGKGSPLGLWQMIPSTARNHGIAIKPGYDGRLSPVESTHAALSYLQLLQPMFKSWQESVMAYNAGENRVRRALANWPGQEVGNGDRHPSGLNNVTYHYLAKLQALSCMIEQPEQAGVELPMDARFERLRELTLDPDISSIEQLADRLGIGAKFLRDLNPVYRGGRVAKGVPRQVLVPFAAANGAMSPAATAP